MTKPETYRTLLVQDIRGQAEATGYGVAVLLGVPLADLQQVDPKNASVTVPKHLAQLGRRRAREAQAATGSKHAGYVLMYWAEKELGDSLVEFDYDEQTRSLWVITNEPFNELY